MQHRPIALLLAVLASLAFASVASAGGWAQVTVKDAPTDPPAGGRTTLNLNVLQHGVTAVSWPRLTVVATDSTSGAVVRTQAQAVGAEGSYVATIVFPTAGDWTLTFDSADLVMEGTADIGVAAAAPVAAPIIAPVEAAATAAATTFDAMPLLLAIVLIAAILAIAIGGLFLRSRGAGHSQVPVRN